MTVYKAIKPQAEDAATVAVELVQGKPVSVATTPVNNGTEDVPSIIYDPVAVTKDNVKDTIVADGYWTAARDLHRPLHGRLHGRRHPVSANGRTRTGDRPRPGGPPKGQSMTAPVLDLKGVSKRFGAVQALTDVDFHVDAGEVVALVGDNGAGKSTLIKAISGVGLADSGEFRFLGEPAQHQRAPGRDRPRHRDRLPGPRPGRQPRRGRRTSTSARSATSRARCAGCGCWTTSGWRSDSGELIRSLSSRIPSVTHPGRLALGWTAPDRGDRPLAARRAQAGAARRAHRGPGRGPDRGRCST